MDKRVLGLVETVAVRGIQTKRVKARIDTGATRSSIDKDLCTDLGIGPVLSQQRVRSAQGSHLRPVVRCVINLRGVEKEVECTVADRSHMRFKVLIGRNVLIGGGFLIDPDKP